MNLQILFLFLFLCIQCAHSNLDHLNLLKGLSNKTIDYENNVIDEKVSSTDNPIGDFYLNNKKEIDESYQNDINLNLLKTYFVCDQTNEFKCNSSNTCISTKLVCDSFKDCPDGSDEQNCKVNCDLDTKFKCVSNDACIDKTLVCNGYPDCDDNSDEEECEDLVSDCKMSYEFACSDGSCIHKNKVCDKTFDCEDHSDELFCEFTCKEDEFKCEEDNRCIHKKFVCDGHQDCLYGSDEKNCTLNDDSAKCEKNQFSCELEPNKCIPIENVCDGVDNCGNNHDEPPECNQKCLNHNCSQICTQEYLTIKCACKPGYKLMSDGTSCEDINECTEISGFCSGHECINTIGSASCICQNGYRYNEEEKRCKVINGKNATLIYSDLKDLFSTSLSVSHKLKLDDNYSDVVIKNISSTGMFVYDFYDNYIVYHDLDEKTLYIDFLNEYNRAKNKNEFWLKFESPKYVRLQNTKRKILIKNITNVEGLALDYVNDLIYWTDTKNNVIEVASIRNPHKRKIIIKTDLDEPKGIVVDVKRSKILWVDWGSRPKIEIANQDGTDRRIFYEKTLEWPSAIAIDPFLDRIYWTDNKKNTLNSVDFDGENFRILLKNPMYIDKTNDLDVFEDRIIWCSQESNAVLSIDKFDLRDLKVLVKGLDNVLNSKVIHFSKQQFKTSNCLGNVCDYLCIPRNDIDSYNCTTSELIEPSHQTLDSSDTNIIKIITKANYRAKDSNAVYLNGLIIFAVALIIACFFIVLNSIKKKANKLKYNNSEYQKTPQDVQQTLPSLLEPLNQPCTNDHI